VQSISVVGAGHLLVAGAGNHVLALIDSVTLEVLQCLRINSSDSDAASSLAQPNILFCKAHTVEGYGHVFVSRFNSTDLLCFRINWQQSVPMIDWVSKHEIEYPVMCIQGAPSSSADQQLRVVLYQTVYVRVFTLDAVVTSIPTRASLTAAPGAEGNGGTRPATNTESPNQHPASGCAEGSAVSSSASTRTAQSESALSSSLQDVFPMQSDSVAPLSRAKVVQNSDVFRSAIQISSSDRTESSTAATTNVANVLSDVLDSSSTPGDYAGCSDISPKIEDAFASLSVPNSSPLLHPAISVSDPSAHAQGFSSSESISTASAASVAAQPPASSNKQETLKLLMSLQAAAKPADSKKEKEQHTHQLKASVQQHPIPKAKASEGKVTDSKPLLSPPSGIVATAPLSDFSKEELDKMLQSRFEVQWSRTEREHRALSESLSKKQAEFESHVLRAIKEAIANQVNSAISKAVSESMKPLQKSIDALIKSSAHSQDSAEALKYAAAGIVQSIGSDFDQRMQVHTEFLLARMDSMLLQQSRVPAPSTSGTEPSAEVLALIKAGQYDSALGLTLNENNAELLMKVLALLEADRVVPTLSHPVMLALIHWCDPAS
jgi:hypothetical protein